MFGRRLNGHGGNAGCALRCIQRVCPITISSSNDLRHSRFSFRRPNVFATFRTL